MNRTVVETGYQPRPLQAEIHRSLKRFNVLVCHRRFGKTVLCINELLDQALRCQRDRPRFAYIAPLYKQAKAIAWDYVKAYTSAIPKTPKNEAELRVDLPNGARIQLLGADNYDALRGIYLDGVVLDEYAQMPPKAWSEVLRPALADRQGWAIFIGTPKGRNAFWELYRGATEGWPDETGERHLDPDWYGALYRQSETGILAPQEVASLRREMDEDEFEQELECSFLAAIAGAYYAKYMGAAEREERIGSIPWEPSVQVTTAWDLGIGDSTAIWFCQQVGHEIRLIDFYQASGVGLEHYVRMLKDKPYVYRDHILPHDANAHDLTIGKTRIAFLHSLGLSDVRVLAKADIDPGIHAVRQLLPRCWFDRTKCDEGIEALTRYRREWDEKNGVFRLRPLHDRNSHAADAFRYLATGLRPERRQERPKIARTDYDELRGKYDRSRHRPQQAIM